MTICTQGGRAGEPRGYRWRLAFLLGSAACLVGWVGARAGDDIALIRIGEPWQYQAVVSAEAPATLDWAQPDYAAAGWWVGPAGFGPVNSYDATWVAGLTTCVRLRREFVVANPADVKWLTLRCNFGGGFVAYLNGTEVVRRSLPGVPGEAVPPGQFAEPHTSGNADAMDLTAFLDRLRPGTNLFAIQAHTSRVPDYGFTLAPELWANFIRGPYLQKATPDSVEVHWSTPLPTTSAVVYGLTPQLGETAEAALPVTRHRILLTNLLPATTYYYRLEGAAAGKTSRSAVRTFRTLPDQGRLRFVVVGDSGQGSAAQYRVASVLERAHADLFLHAGDIAYPHLFPGLIDLRFFSVYRPQLESIPFFTVVGNHEFYGNIDWYFATFSLPTNSVATRGEFYSFEAGEVHFAMLYTAMFHQLRPVPGDAQQLWLDADLAATQKPWKIIVCHMPLFSSSIHADDDYDFSGRADMEEFREWLLPVARRHGVQLVITAHEHAFERFRPVDGVQTIYTGGGGGRLYPFARRDPASVQFWERYNCVAVDVTRDTLRLEALGENGECFDAMTLPRTLPGQALGDASWDTGPRAPGSGDDGDGNRFGQAFERTGLPCPALHGLTSSLGRVRVANDRDYLYLRLDEVMLGADQIACLFVEVPRLAGVDRLSGLGNGLPDPAGGGVDGLDFLENLSFVGFAPAVACLAGDEYADTNSRSFRRPDQELGMGQGVFRLVAGLPDLPGARLQQYNRSPQANPEPGEQNADFVEIAIPLAELGGLGPGEVIRLGAVVAGGPPEIARQSQRIDTGFLGRSLTAWEAGAFVLEGMSFRLAADPDPDQDGATTEEELAAGTDPDDPDSVLRLGVVATEDGAVEMRWGSVPGRSYVLEMTATLAAPFANMDPAVFPRTAVTGTEAYTLPGDAGHSWVGARYFRVRLAVIPPP